MVFLHAPARPPVVFLKTAALFMLLLIYFRAARKDFLNAALSTHGSSPCHIILYFQFILP